MSLIPTRMDSFQNRQAPFIIAAPPTVQTPCAIWTYDVMQEYIWHLVSHVDESRIEDRERHEDAAEEEADDIFRARDVKAADQTLDASRLHHPSDSAAG
jgi:hypothetical protein